MGLVDRAEVRDAADAWTGRVNSVNARTDRVDVNALLIRPDGYLAWALPTGRDLDDTTLVVRWAPGSANRPEHRINSRLRFAR
ncbi:aromatic-ring hydroxylase C-terminal domain-containing protein [Streptomyces sviceus]|uniref:aromatic-ring hydroxylase C-terminal domain-containing protein n=1 Tax=Streptomyces sviceus TaxID=285530 RepID=UPI0036CF80C9